MEPDVKSEYEDEDSFDDDDDDDWVDISDMVDIDEGDLKGRKENHL